MESKHNNHLRIEHFQPRIKHLSSATTNELRSFHAGNGFKAFDLYLSGDDVMSDAESGKGVTHLIWNEFSNDTRELVAYFTIAVTAIPYDDGIDENPRMCDYPSISALELKMFAVSEKYQDVFFKMGDADMPVSAWCLHAIIHYADFFSSNMAGIQAIFLHSVPTAEQFYSRNRFSYLPEEARPLYSIDAEYKAMWMPIRKCPLPIVDTP